MSFNERVYEIVAKIPYGMVMNYGQIASVAGSPRCARMVGYALHALKSGTNLPWHRVVFKDGSLADFGDDNLQYKLLKAEKVSFNRDKKVDMAKHNWDAAEILVEKVFL